MSLRFPSRRCVLFGLLLSAALGPAAGAAPLNLRLNAGPDTFAPALTVTDGATKAPLAIAWKSAAGGFLGTTPGLRFTVTPSRAGEMATVRLGVQNTGRGQRRLQFALSTPVRMDAATAAYWDGHYRETRPRKGAQEDRTHEEAYHFVPLSAAGDGKSALLVALTPDTLCSYFRASLEYAPGRQSVFGQAIRLVVNAGQSDGVTVAAGRVRGTAYGLMPASWQLYQRAFPRYFRPATGVDDSIWGASAQYAASGGVPNPEMLRRLHVTWDWFYAPFKRVGDIIARDEEWKYEPQVAPFSKHPFTLGRQKMDLGAVSAAEFREARRQVFDEYGLDCGLMFYSLVQWMEKALARQKFPDALVQDPDHKTELNAWCKVYDSEVLVAPTGTSYKKRVLADMARIARDLETPGFALDVFINRERNRAAWVSAKPLSGRAWDDKGVYREIGVSLAELADALHRIEVKDRPFQRLALVGGYGTPGFHTDATLYEMTFYGPEKRKFPAWRMSMGTKPGVTWKGWDIPDILPNWEKMSRHDFVKAFWVITDYTILKCFQWGTYPTYANLAGVDKFQERMPLLVELVRSGWQPLAPVRVSVPDKVHAWTSRYGEGAGNSIAIGSPNEAPAAARVEVDNRLLGPLDSVYVDRRAPRRPLAQRLAGRITRLEATLPRRDVLVWRSVLGVRAEADLRATAHMEEALDRMDVTVELTTPRAVTAALAAPAVPGFGPAALSLNGKPVTPGPTAAGSVGRPAGQPATAGAMRPAAAGVMRQAGQPATAGVRTTAGQPAAASVIRLAGASVSLPAGKSTIRLSYPSAVFHFPREALERFAFLAPDGKAQFAVVAPQRDRRDYRRVAGRFDRYFRFYSQRVLHVKDAPPAHVAADAARAGAPNLVRLTIGAGAGARGWSLSPDGKTLSLHARDEGEAVRLTEALLRVLDGKYRYAVPFPGGMAGFYQPVQVKHRMIGKTLSEILAEEGIQ